MNKKLVIITSLIVIPLIFIMIFYSNIFNEKEKEEVMKDYKVKILVNDKELILRLLDNSSSEAFVSKLKENDLTINASDYGNFEKVGDLGFSLPTNDQYISVKAGDLILYQGDKISLYYDENNYSFTKLGYVINMSENDLKELLGKKEDVILVFSLIES